MSDPYVGEIRMFAGNFAPVGWALCNGSLLPIAEFSALYNLIGTTYGGDGQSTFALPNLLGRIPVHQGPGFMIGQLAGEEEVTLTTSQIPAHNHPANGQAGAGTQPGPTGNVWASSALGQYSAGPASDTMSSVLGATGGSLPHDNMMPYLVINFIISLFGIFPSQN